MFNALLQYLRVNNFEWDQILLETKETGSVWIHWSYSRGHRIGIYQNLLRFYDHNKIPGVPINNSRTQKPVSDAAKTYNKNETRMWDLAGNTTTPTGGSGLEMTGSGTNPQGQTQSGIPTGQAINGTVTDPNGVQGALNYAGQI